MHVRNVGSQKDNAENSTSVTFFTEQSITHLTTLIGVMSFFFLTNFPDDATWLTEKEKDFIFTKTITPRDVLFFKDGRKVLAAVKYFYKPIALSVAVLCYPLFLAYCHPSLQQVMKDMRVDPR